MRLTPGCSLEVVRVLAMLIAVLSMSAGELSAQPALEQDPAPRPSTLADDDGPVVGPMLFDLPSMPLAMALARYGELTRRSLLYETRWVSGRHSSPVQGVYPPDEALARLLSQSGLSARVLSPEAVSVAPQAGSGARGGAPASSPSGSAAPTPQAYDSYLRQRIAVSLCGMPALRDEMPRIVLRLAVGEARRAESLRVSIESRPALEPSVRAAISGLDLAPPPPDMAQPILMMIRPASNVCGSPVARP
ncbi:Outer membrane receptor for ferric coprogen and ferric-rhodotorulic acid [Bordetella ansorpii]|uniref:Outer membrane receptor for ferric coprogen and ferric-rhodotorulic acid n=2 Tax=Bordetella ansorpii TaxID=288768 RepID=A0A157MMI7_9BORD|nr:Outer membrane receptor for ferric coprogen and ferric-rhodotorulic acid [Bordetella ansorpii]